MQLITNSDKTFQVLNKLLDSSFYNGYIENNKFEMSSNRWPNNHKIIGLLNEDNHFNLSFDYKYPTNIAIKILFVFIILTSLYFLINGIYLIPIISLIFGGFLLVRNRLKRKKLKDF